MAVVNTGLNEAAIRGEFLEKLESASKQTIWQDLTTRIPSMSDRERYRWLGSVPPMREWGTGRKAQGLFNEAFDVENLKYELTLEIDRDEISDDKLNHIRIRIGEMAERAAFFKDSEVARLLINGHSAGFHAYDGKPFFAADHESGKSGAQSNLLSVNVGTPAAPTVAELHDVLSQAIARLLSLKDDQSEPANTSATGLVVICPGNHYIPLLQALNSSLVASSTNVLQGAARVHAFSRLSADSVFYILKTDTSVRPLIFQDREPIEFKAMEDNSESGFMREVYHYGVRARFRLTYGLWQRALKVTLT